MSCLVNTRCSPLCTAPDVNTQSSAMSHTSALLHIAQWWSKGHREVFFQPVNSQILWLTSCHCTPTADGDFSSKPDIYIHSGYNADLKIEKYLTQRVLLVRKPWADTHPYFLETTFPVITSLFKFFLEFLTEQVISKEWVKQQTTTEKSSAFPVSVGTR